MGAAPTLVEATWPPLNSMSVGMPRTPYCDGVFGLSSILILTTLTLSPSSLAISSSAGRDHLARAAPFRPEIDNHRAIGFEDIGLEGGVGNLMRRHVNLVGKAGPESAVVEEGRDRRAEGQGRSGSRHMAAMQAAASQQSHRGSA